MNKISEIVAALAQPVCEKHGCELWDVEYLKEGGQWYLRVYIDKPEGVNISDCEAVSREMDDILDEADPIPDSYVFEVSSAGAERQLKRPSDFMRFIGSTIEVKLYKGVDGKKTFIGQLCGYRDGDVTLNIGGTEMTFAKAQVANVRLKIV